MIEKLYSKNNIVSLEVGRLKISKFAVEPGDGIRSVRNTDKNCNAGFLFHFLENMNRNEKASIYAYRPEVSEDFVVILPHVYLTFSNAEVIKVVFNTDEELDNYLSEHGLRKLLTSNQFFNPHKK